MDEDDPERVLLGALVGWRRTALPQGGLVRLQIARSGGAREAREYDVALSVPQLRTLGEDLIRAADEREGRPTQHKRRWWQG